MDARDNGVLSSRATGAVQDKLILAVVVFLSTPNTVFAIKLVLLVSRLLAMFGFSLTSKKLLLSGLLFPGVALLPIPSDMVVILVFVLLIVWLFCSALLIAALVPLSVLHAEICRPVSNINRVGMKRFFLI